MKRSWFLSFFNYLLVFLVLFYENVFLQISEEKTNQNPLKWLIFQTLNEDIEKQLELFGVARNTVLKVMTAFEKEGKTLSQKQNSGRKRKLSERDLRSLTWIV